MPRMSTETLTLAQKKALFQAAVSDTALDLFPEYIEELKTEGTSDDYRKFLQFAIDVCDFRQAPPKDQYANLSTTSINIIMPGQPAAITVENVVETLDMSKFTPTAAMQLASHINADIELDEDD